MSGDDGVDERHLPVGETADGEPLTLPTVEILTGRGFVTGKSGGGKSILEGTPVHTETGRKPIEAVEEGEQVLSLNKHTYEQEFREVQATLEHTAENLVRLTLEDGTELIGTEDHSFLTVDDMEIVPVEGADVEVGTWLPLSRELPSVETTTEFDLADYVPDRNNLTVREETIQSGPRSDDRYLTLNFDTGKEIGLYLAEGSFDSGETLQISNLDDGVRGFLDKRGFNVHERTCNKGFKPYARFLKRHFGMSSDGKSLPNWVFETPDEFRAGLVSGYFDGDGTINESSASAMSNSPALLTGLKEVLRQFGVSTTLRDKFVMYEGEERTYTRLTVDAFSLPRFADVVDLSVESKAERLGDTLEGLDTGASYNTKDMIPGFGPVLNQAARERGWTKRESEGCVAGASIHSLTRKQKAGRDTYQQFVDELGIEGRAKAFGESDVQWKRVVEVEPLEETRTVYDLDVEMNDNFVANGVFVHNSNTTSVVLEELLERQYPVMVVDTDGEYYGLKEEYELLHAGADEGCDIQVSPEHAERLATIALEENVPVILDVSGFLDEDEADELVFETARHLFAKEKKLKKPFLLVIEEVHEYIPEGAGLGETGRMLIKVGKRGRKHGLGVVGISQRPADVKKDFITQANWLVWHRLTWENDTKVVGRIVGSEYKNEVPELDAGEAFVQADWTDEAVQRVQFKRKRTFDAGATPGLDDFERPELKSVSDTLVEDLSDITSAEEQRQDRIADLERKLENREARIAELEDELDRARDVSAAARKLANAVAHGDIETTQATLAETGGDTDEQGDIAALRERIDELEARLVEADERTETATYERSASVPDSRDAAASDDADDHATDEVDSLEAQLTELGEDDGSEDAETDAAESEYGDLEPDESIEDVLERLQRSSERERGESESDHAGRARADRARDGQTSETTSTPAAGRASDGAAPDGLLDAPAVQVRLDAARRASRCNDRVATAVYEALADAPQTAHALADATDTTIDAVHSLLVELRGRDLVVKDRERRYAFHEPSLRDLAAEADERTELGELGEQWRVS